MKVRVTEIEWETDGHTPDLPAEMTLDLELDGLDEDARDVEISEALMDETDWLVEQFRYECADGLQGRVVDNLDWRPAVQAYRVEKQLD